MRISKRITAVLLSVLMAVGLFGALPPVAPSADPGDFVAPVITVPNSIPTPDDDMLSEGNYIIAQGTRYEKSVHSKFIAPGNKNRPVTSEDTHEWNHQKYICIHNTGNYNPSAGAANNASYCRNPNTVVSWHYTVGNDSIEQQLPVNELGKHAGNYEHGDPYTNFNTIGIETVDAGIPADGPYGTPYWNTTAVYDWYANQFDLTATYLAMHVACLCVRLNFNPYTQICQHASCINKNCPRIMRYVFGTNAQFKYEGTYFKVFLDRMYDYYKAFGGSYLPTDTVINEYYNPNPATVYHKGLYKSGSAITVYRAGHTSTGTVGTIPAGNVADVQTVGFNWGRVVLANGTVGWIKLPGLTYVGNTYRLGTYKTSGGSIVNVTNISGSTGYYEGGSAAMSTLTKVYKVTVHGDTAFGSAPKYLAPGASFTVTAAASASGSNFEMWELMSGAAAITSKTAASTTVKVINSDIVLHASYNDKFDLSVIDGSGSGRYSAGTTVDIQAATKEGGKFSRWELVSGSGTFADSSAFTTTFTTGAQNTVIRAVFKEAGVFDPGGLTNYALKSAYGTSYTTKWKGSEDIAYYNPTPTSNPDNKSHFDTNHTKMTDNVRASGAFNHMTDTIYASFIGTGQEACFTFDLKQLRGIKMAAIFDIAVYNSFGLIRDGTVKVETSADGSGYAPVSGLSVAKLNSYSGSAKIENSFTYQLDFAPVSARYVRVSFTSGAYCLCVSEIGIYGSEGAAPPPPPPPPPPKYTLTVQGGTGGGSYAAGKVVKISGTSPGAGWVFAGWTIVSGSGSFANAAAESTTFTMGAGNAVIKANYKEPARLEFNDAAQSSGCEIEEGHVSGVAPGNSVVTVKAMFKFEVTITKKGVALANNEPVGTGCVVSCGGESATFVVKGDLIGSDGVVDTTDYVGIKVHVKGRAPLGGVYEMAADCNSDRIVSLADVIFLKAAIMNP